MLTVTTAAADRSLLSIEELRALAGVTNSSMDTELAEVGLRASDIIAEHCRVGGDGLTPVTLLRETVVETIRLTRAWTPALILARRFLGDVSVVEDGTTLDDTDFAVDAPAGMLTRLYADEPCAWAGRKIAVTYEAGFVTPPSALKEAASKLVRLNLSTASRDPLLKDDTVDGVGRQTFWVGPVEGGSIPRDVADLLTPYRNQVV
jgi:hypothetical protein